MLKHFVKWAAELLLPTEEVGRCLYFPSQICSVSCLIIAETVVAAFPVRPFSVAERLVLDSET